VRFLSTDNGGITRGKATKERPPEALRERVEHAVRRCPKLALSIVED
jgi:ferredoxin